MDPERYREMLTDKVLKLVENKTMIEAVDESRISSKRNLKKFLKLSKLFIIMLMWETGMSQDIGNMILY